MNRKQFIVLLIVGLVIGGLGLFLYNRRSSSYTTPDTALGRKLAPDFAINDVAALTIQQHTNEVNLASIDGKWRVKERWNYPADFGKVSDLARKVWDLKVIQAIDAGPSQHGRLELLPPEQGTNSATLLAFKDKSDKNLQALLLGKKYMKSSGNSSPFGGGDFPVGRYILSLGETGKVWVVSEAFSEVEPKPEQWLNKDFFKVTNLRSISVTSTNATNSWKVTRDTATAEWKLVDAKEGEALDTSKTYSLNNALSSPSFNDVVNPEAKPETVGLDHAHSAVLETFDGFVYTVNVGNKLADDSYHIRINVDANLQKERTAPADEKPEDKEKLDKEFKENLAKLEEKLKQEEEFEKWTYLVSKWTIDPVLKERKELLAEKKEEKPSDTNAPPANAQSPPLIPEDLLNRAIPAPPPLPAPIVPTPAEEKPASVPAGDAAPSANTNAIAPVTPPTPPAPEEEKK